MSHITCDEQREMNKRMNECLHRAVPCTITYPDYMTGEPVQEESTRNECGEWKTLSAAQDKCLRCGLIFTY